MMGNQKKQDTLKKHRFWCLDGNASFGRPATLSCVGAPSGQANHRQKYDIVSRDQASVFLMVQQHEAARNISFRYVIKLRADQQLCHLIRRPSCCYTSGDGLFWEERNTRCRYHGRRCKPRANMFYLRSTIWIRCGLRAKCLFQSYG